VRKNKMEKQIKSVKKYNQIKTIVDVMAIERRISKETSIVLTDEDKNTYKYKLLQDVKEVSTLKNGLEFIKEERKPVTSEQIINFIPDSVNLLIKAISKDKKVKVHLTYLETTITENGEDKIYNTMTKEDIETLYIPSLHKDVDNLNKQLERESKSNMKERPIELVND